MTMENDYMFDTADVALCEKKTVKERLLDFIKNRQTWGFLISVAIMAVISLAFFYPDNFEGNDLRQHDMLQGMANGQEVKAFEEATGEVSRWTNSLFSGMPTFQISPSYPSDSLFKWFTKVYGLGLPSPSNLLFMMMLGFMILMTAMKVRWEYGLIGAIAWGFSTYFIIIIGAGHIWKFVTLSYIPPTIAGVLLAYRGRYLAGSAMAAFFAMMQLCSNHVQMTYYFGFVILGVIIAYAVAFARKKEWKKWCKATVALAIAALLAVCANLPNLYHTQKYAKETQRGKTELVKDMADNTGGLDRDYITQYSYGVSETFTLLIPNVKGGASAKPEKGRMTAMSLAQLDEAGKYSHDDFVSFYLNYSSQYFGEPESTNGPVYVGAIIFLLFVIGCIVVKGPLKWALLILTILSVFLAWGRNFSGLTDLFIDFVPLYNKFRTPESILVIAEFTMPLLAILGLYKLLSDRKEIEKNFRKVTMTFGVVAAICLAGALMPGIFGPGLNMENEEMISQNIGEMLNQNGYPDEIVREVNINNPKVYNAVEKLHYGMCRQDSLRSLAFVAVAMLFIALYRYKKLAPTLSAIGIGALVFADLYTVNKRYISHDSFAKVGVGTERLGIQPDEIDRAIIADAGDNMNYRVADFDNLYGADRSYFHKMIGGYHAAKLGRYQEILESGLITQPNILDMLNTRYIIYQGQIMPNDESYGNVWFVDGVEYVDNANDELLALRSLETGSRAVSDKRFADMLGKSSMKTPGDTIYETSYAPNKLTYQSHTGNDVVAVFSEVYFPWGWKGEIDGKPAEIARVNYILRAMRIPAGDHVITMTFDPQSVHTTTAIATIAVILIYLSVIAAIAGALLCNGCCPIKGKMAA